MYISAKRATEEDGIQETSRLAMLRMCHIHARELKDTVFRLHPRAPAVDRLAHYPTIDEERDAMVFQLTHFVAAQEKALEVAREELHGTYEIIKIVECTTTELEETLYDKDSLDRC